MNESELLDLMVVQLTSVDNIWNDKDQETVFNCIICRNDCVGFKDLVLPSLIFPTICCVCSTSFVFPHETVLETTCDLCKKRFPEAKITYEKFLLNQREIKLINIIRKERKNLVNGRAYIDLQTINAMIKELFFPEVDKK